MTIRKIEPFTAPMMQFTPPGDGAGGPEPKFGRADPAELYVDETYQRGLSERSRALIRRLIVEWDWCSFAPPVVVRTKGGKLHVIDGQHTAIAAASHPKIKDIPVMIVEAEAVAKQAKTFLNRNRNRLAVSQCQLHIAAVAAGDEDAVTVDQVCRRAKVRILGFAPNNYSRASDGFEIGDTMAISSLRTLVSKRGAMRARKVLDELVAAELAPIPAAFIKAAEEIMFGAEHAAAFEKPGTLARVINRTGEDALARSGMARQRTRGGAFWLSLAAAIAANRT